MWLSRHHRRRSAIPSTVAMAAQQVDLAGLGAGTPATSPLCYLAVLLVQALELVVAMRRVLIPLALYGMSCVRVSKLAWRCLPRRRDAGRRGSPRLNWTCTQVWTRLR